ncbi:MAG: type III pantothenate kinase [Maribacter sp.]|nr:type III pantothenate kinase [Maribacter sp.]
MNLILDVGNTFVKLAVFNNGRLIHDESTMVSNLHEKAEVLCQRYPKIDWAIIASVVDLNEIDINKLTSLCKVYILDHDSKLPFKNSYSTPKTLGVDRIALVTAAFFLHQQRNSLVIDAGTCITYDLITDQGEYLGGAISPGIKMRYSALNNQTSKLPFLNIELPKDLIGNSTESSIHSGVVNGVCAEIDGVIDQYASRFQDLTVILTGGDSQFLSKRLKNTIFAHSNFLLEGLNYLLDYNKR